MSRCGTLIMTKPMEAVTISSRSSSSWRRRKEATCLLLTPYSTVKKCMKLFRTFWREATVPRLLSYAGSYWKWLIIRRCRDVSRRKSIPSLEQVACRRWLTNPGCRTCRRYCWRLFAVMRPFRCQCTDKRRVTHKLEAASSRHKQRSVSRHAHRIHSVLIAFLVDIPFSNIL